MPLFKTYHWQMWKIAIWHICESEEELALGLALSEEEARKLASCKNPSRRCEFWALRRCLHYLLGYLPKVTFDENGKPFLPRGPQISFSHNHDYATVVVSDLLQVGIDIESCRPNMLRVAPRFLSTPEKKSVLASQKLAHYTAYWCAKEALLKVEGNKQLDFKKQIHVSPFVLHRAQISRAYISGYSHRYQLLLWSLEPFTLCLAHRKMTKK